MKKLKYLGLFILTVSFSDYLRATDYYLKPTGAITSTASWGTNTNGTGTSPVVFSNAGDVWHFANRTSLTNLTVFNINAAATAVIEANFNLICLAAGEIKGLINVASSGTLTISNTTFKTFNLNSLDPNSTVVYNTSVINVMAEDYGHLTIAASNTLVNAGTIWVYGTLTINAGRTLTLNGNGLNLNGLNGSIAGTGNFAGDALAFITFLGGNGGNNGTINFAPGFNTLDYFIIQFDNATDYITLGSNLNITLGAVGALFQVSGGIDLNGNNLTIENGADINFVATSSDGVIRGNSSSKLFIDGSVGFYLGTTELFMDATNNTLGVLSLNSAVATLTAGNTLNIADSLSIQGGGSFETNNNVTLVSSSTLKGRLGNMNNGTLTGDLRVQTFARGGTTDWVNIGVSGVTGETINSGWYGQIPMAIEGSTTGVTSAGGYYFESVQRWNESVSYYDTLVTVNDALTPGEGYWVFLGTGLTTTSDMVWTVSGPAVTGAQVISLTNSGVTSSVSTAGWNLIANPFPSPIDWSSVMANNPSPLINNAYYVYDPDLGGTISFAGGIATPGSGPLTNYQTMADVIPMGQAFYVEVTGNVGLTISEGDKSSNNTTNFQLLKSNQTASIGSPIRLNIDGGGYHDDAVIRFHSSATANFDKALDAHKMYSSPGYAGYPGQWSLRTAIATQSNNEDYSINSIPYAQTQNAVMPVVARVYQSGTHTISATELQNLPPGTCVDLKDLYTNTVYDLTSGPCIVTMSDTTYYPRFELTVCASVATSVKNNSVKNAPAIAISKDAVGIYSDFNFTEQTDVKITITNILGQKIVDDKKVSVKNERVYIDANLNDNIIFVTVETSTERITRKFLNLK